MVLFSFWVVHPSHSLAEGKARKLIVSAPSHAWQFGYPDVDSCFILFLSTRVEIHYVIQ